MKNGNAENDVGSLSIEVNIIIKFLMYDFF